MRRIPDDNLSYPISVQLSNGGQGTGFIVSNSDFLYFVTAKHVLFNVAGTLLAPEAICTAYNRTMPGDPKIVLRVNLATLHQDGALLAHPTQDAAAFRVARLVSIPGPHQAIDFTAGVDISNPANAGLVGVDSTQHVKRFAEVLEANEIVLFGYPVSLGLASQPQLDLSKPLLRHGIVAARNGVNRTIILDCPSYPGNSGGPVIEIEIEPAGFRFSMIGILVAFVPSAETWTNRQYGYDNVTITNSGYSVVVPFDAVDELMATFHAPTA